MYASNCLVSAKGERERLNKTNQVPTLKFSNTYRIWFLAKISFEFAGIIPRSFFHKTELSSFSMCPSKFSEGLPGRLQPRHFRMSPSMPEQ